MNPPEQPLPDHLKALLALAEETQDQSARQFFHTYRDALLFGGAFLAQLVLYSRLPGCELPLVVLFLGLLGVMFALHRVLDCQIKRRLRLYYEVLRELQHRSER